MAKILVVEDDVLAGKLLRDALSAAKHDIVVATSAEEALSVLPHSQIELAITDVVLPGLSGPQLVERMRAEYPDLPVIVISGNLSFAAKLDLAGLGVRAALDKPFRIVELLTAVRRALGDP